MVAGAAGGDAVGRGGAERGDLVHRPADLERAGALQALGLEHDRAAAGELRERRRADQRGVPGERRRDGAGGAGCRRASPRRIGRDRSGGYGGARACARSSATPTTSTRASSVIASASTATPSPSAIASTPTEWPALDGHELVLTLGSEWNVYRPETAELVEAEAAFLRERGRGRRPAARHLLRRPGARPRLRRDRQPHADAGDRLVRRRGRRTERSPPDRGCSGTRRVHGPRRLHRARPLAGRTAGRSAAAGRWRRSSTPRSPRRWSPAGSAWAAPPRSASTAATPTSLLAGHARRRRAQPPERRRPRRLVRQQGRRG